MDTIRVKINGFEYEVPAGSTVLEAAHSAGIEIPTLCYLKDINAIGACRICLVEVKEAEGRPAHMVASCVFPANDGMEIFTNSPKVRENRRMTLELILSTHKKECLACVRNGSCELQKLCNEYGIEDENAMAGDTVPYDIRPRSMIKSVFFILFISLFHFSLFHFFTFSRPFFH